MNFDGLYGVKGGDKRLYLISGNTKYWVTNPDVFYSLGFNWNSVEYVNKDRIDLYTEGVPITSVNQKIFENQNYVLCIENSWSDDYHVGLVGWIVGKKRGLSKMLLEVDGVTRDIDTTKDRNEIYEFYSRTTKYKVNKKCGFSLLFLRKATHELRLGLDIDNMNKHSYSPEKHSVISEYCGEVKSLNKRFFDYVNNEGKSVLEVGSRVSPGGVSKRGLFNSDIEYVGFDYLGGETVDVVGDAHVLSKYFKNKKFDAIFSDSVLEHLAMPWKAIIEMNKCLSLGGYMFHSVPSCWSLHDMPWDFWRFSDAGLRALCSKPFGFRVIDVEYTCPVKIHIDNVSTDDYAEFGLSPAFGFVQVLAEKIADIDNSKICFDVTLKDVVGRSVYPEWSK